MVHFVDVDEQIRDLRREMRRILGRAKMFESKSKAIDRVKIWEESCRLDVEKLKRMLELFEAQARVDDPHLRNSDNQELIRELEREINRCERRWKEAIESRIRLHELAEKAERCQAEAWGIYCQIANLEAQRRFEDLHVYQCEVKKKLASGEVKAYKTWRAAWREGGKVRTVHLGMVGKISLEEATARARLLKLRSMASWVDWAPMKKKRDEKPHREARADLAVSKKVGLSPRTVRSAVAFAKALEKLQAINPNAARYIVLGACGDSTKGVVMLGEMLEAGDVETVRSVLNEIERRAPSAIESGRKVWIREILREEQMRGRGVRVRRLDLDGLVLRLSPEA